jgi:hypothetical protein
MSETRVISNEDLWGEPEPKYYDDPAWHDKEAAKAEASGYDVLALYHRERADALRAPSVKP